MEQVLTRVRSVRAYLLMTYDFLAWVLSFVAMATLQYVVGYSGSDDIAPAALFGVSCGVGFILLGSTVNLHRGRSPVGSFPDAVLTSDGRGPGGVRRAGRELLARLPGQGVGDGHRSDGGLRPDPRRAGGVPDAAGVVRHVADPRGRSRGNQSW